MHSFNGDRERLVSDDKCKREFEMCTCTKLIIDPSFQHVKLKRSGTPEIKNPGGSSHPGIKFLTSKAVLSFDVLTNKTMDNK